MMEGDQDQPYPQAVVLSQTCWEYRTLLSKESASHEQQHACNRSDEALRKIATPSPSAGEGWPKQSKTSGVCGEKVSTCSGTTPLETLRRVGQEGKSNAGVELWDVFVLVLQASGLQQITSKRGSEVDFGTLLVADPSLSFFRLTLWGRAARAGGRLVRAGDLIRFNGVSVSSFRGTVQACSTQSTSFRVVWRGDTFTTPEDAPNTTMPSPGWRSTRGRREFQSGPILSQGNDLAVSRDAACDLAAWAKIEFPSVTSSDPDGQNQQGHQAASVVSGAAADAALTGSLGAVRKGVEATVRACVLEVSEVERLWMWESTGGKRRKDLVSRATALLTDGLTEMTLQLWGDMASDETVDCLRRGSLAAVNGLAAGTIAGNAMEQPAVFEFTRLQPAFSFSCEALVLNGRSGTATRMDRDSAEALSVSKAVLASAAAAAAVAVSAVGSTRYEGSQGAPATALSAQCSCAETASYLVGGEGAPACTRRFDSVAALMSADGFSGAGYLRNVVVRKVDAPSLSAPGLSSAPGGHSRDGSLPPASGDVAAPPVMIYFGDPEESMPAPGWARSAGVEAVLGVTADGVALQELLGGIPSKLLRAGTGSHGEPDDVADFGGRVALSLLDGLEVGGQRGERVDAALACSASMDENGRIITGGTSYRLISLHPKCRDGV